VVQFEEGGAPAHEGFHEGPEADGDEVSEERYLALLPAGEAEQRSQATDFYFFFPSSFFLFLFPLRDFALGVPLLVFFSKASRFLLARTVGLKGIGFNRRRTMSLGVGGVTGSLPFLRVAQHNNSSASVGLRRLRGRAGDPGWASTHDREVALQFHWPQLGGGGIRQRAHEMAPLLGRQAALPPASARQAEILHVGRRFGFPRGMMRESVPVDACRPLSRLGRFLVDPLFHDIDVPALFFFVVFILIIVVIIVFIICIEYLYI